MVKLLDAGFSTQLSKYIDEEIDGHPLWTARFLFTSKETCLRVHRDFVRAGAQIIITGSYQASIEGFKKYLGLDRETSISLIKESVTLAKNALETEEKNTGKKLHVRIAGSIGPYGAYLHDGSDYTGSYAQKLSKEELKVWHKPRLDALLDGGADLLAFETIPASIEAEALIELLKEHPQKKAWLSFSCKDNERISNGETFKDVAIKCWELGQSQLIAIGVNCVQPSFVTPLLAKVRETHPEIPLIAYPNSGEIYSKEKGRWLDKTTSLCVTDYTEEWLDLGINYIGGCCRTNDKDVKQFSEEIEKWMNKTKTQC
ncbi:hypothetical protein AAG570_001368 [Ranatra chinensis]|uniref:Hcy-binding domain-containing protein n=1 Tax=Ranatra chinensis TaxID=642074 RepID=A0ABD0YQG6_9HEMI